MVSKMEEGAGVAGVVAAAAAAVDAGDTMAHCAA
jgi:hypothetical protein